MVPVIKLTISASTMTMVKATLEQIIERKFVFKLKHSMKVPTHPRVREMLGQKK